MAEGVVGADGAAVEVPGGAQVPAAPGGPAYPPPPRRGAAPADPEAPYGRKADGSPRAKPGAKPQTAKPRTERSAPASAPSTPGPAADYTQELADFGEAVWLGMAALPFTRAPAALWKLALPGQVRAWNEAARQNETVRGYVERLGGGPTWIVGIAVASAPLVGGLAAMMRDPAIRAELAAVTEAEWTRFVAEARGKYAAEMAALLEPDGNGQADGGPAEPEGTPPGTTDEQSLRRARSGIGKRAAGRG